MSPQAFQAAHLRRMQASPFSGKLTVKMNGSALEVVALVEDEMNKSEVQEFGADSEWVLQAHIAKKDLPRRPDPTLDLVIHRGRTYRITAVGGDVDASPVWDIEARSPKS